MKVDNNAPRKITLKLVIMIRRHCVRNSSRMHLGEELERAACLEHLSVFERVEGEERGVCAQRKGARVTVMGL